jgi:hypothetical protein
VVFKAKKKGTKAFRAIKTLQKKHFSNTTFLENEVNALKELVRDIF